MLDVPLSRQTLAAVLALAAVGCSEGPSRTEPQARGERAACPIGALRYSSFGLAVPDVPPADSAWVLVYALGPLPADGGAGVRYAERWCRGAACAAGLRFDGFAPDTVEVIVKRRGAILREVITPTYRRLRPEGCDWVYREGEAVFGDPGAATRRG